jgi:hypothetical protein
LVLSLSELEADRFVVVTERSVPVELVSEVCAEAETVAPTIRLVPTRRAALALGLRGVKPGGMPEGGPFDPDGYR